jgi:redox-sensitive bicupin YhaK (pirin superfamily)
VNLPAKDKMSPPTYQPIVAKDIPAVTLPDNAGSLRVIAGAHGATPGPARSFTSMNVWDLQLRGGASTSLELPAGHNALLVVLKGSVRVGTEGRALKTDEVAVLERAGTTLQLACDADAMLLLLTGEPIAEPVVGYGPFVMNTREQIMHAIDDFNSGGFGEMPAR